MQKYKDSAQLDAMYKMAGMGGDNEEDDEEPTRKKSRCHLLWYRFFEVNR